MCTPARTCTNKKGKGRGRTSSEHLDGLLRRCKLLFMVSLTIPSYLSVLSTLSLPPSLSTISFSSSLPFSFVFLDTSFFKICPPPKKKTDFLKKGEHIKPYGVCLALLYSLSYIYTHTQTYIHIHIYTYDVQKRISLKGLRTWGLSVQQVLCLLSKKLFRKSIECVIICQNSFHPVMHNSRQCRRISTGAPS